MKFSEKIVRLRKIKGITQDEFASAVGVSRQAVYKWECGQSYPEAAKLIEIKALFGISIDDLLDENYEVAMPEKKKRKRISKARIEKIEKAVEAELAPVVENEQPEVEEYIPTEEVTVVEVEAEPLMSEDAEKTVVEVAEQIVEAAEAEEAPAYAATVLSENAKISTSEDTANQAVENKEEAPKRRGFFSRIFGRK